MRFIELTGKNIAPHIQQVAAMRIKYFKEFPYLYEGHTDYETNYLQGYLTDNKSMLVAAFANGEPVAVSTAIPLVGPSDIVADGPDLFRKAGHNPNEFYYYGEIIISKAFRHQGLARQIYQRHEVQAKAWGFTKLCLAVVVRDDHHPLAPPGYERKKSEIIWQTLGFHKTNIYFSFHWPVIQTDGTAIDQENEMVYWIKDISK